MFFYLDEVEGIVVISGGGHAEPRTKGFEFKVVFNLIQFKTQLVPLAACEWKANKL